MYSRRTTNSTASSGEIPTTTPVPFSFSQRLNRLRICCYMLTGGVIMALITALLWIYMLASWMPEWGVEILLAMLVGLQLAAFIWYIGLLVSRLHDLDRSGGWLLLAFVPLVNFLFFLYLLLGPGSSSVNRFGAPNPPNGMLVMLGGGLWWALQIANIAVIVTLITAVFVNPDGVEHWFQAIQDYSGTRLPAPGP